MDFFNDNYDMCSDSDYEDVYSEYDTFSNTIVDSDGNVILGDDFSLSQHIRGQLKINKI